MLEGRMNEACYSVYFTRFAPILEKKHIWQQNLINAKTDRDVISISSEAFGLLVLENQWDRWVDIYVRSGGDIVTDKNFKLKDVNTTVAPNFTRGGTALDEPEIKKRASKKDSKKGWTARGIQRFNELYDLVAADRTMNPDFFEAWIRNMRNTVNSVVVKKKRALKSNKASGKWSLAEVEESDKNSKSNLEKIALINKKVVEAEKESDNDEELETESSEEGTSSEEEEGSDSGDEDDDKSTKDIATSSTKTTKKRLEQTAKDTTGGKTKGKADAPKKATHSMLKKK